jgi:4-diphosphocytidyl-2-C-methyl-D-erythritol kinase
VIDFPNAKINLGLRILHKREDGFHELETIFYHFPLHDALEVIRDPKSDENFQLQLSGITIDAKTGDNICHKAYQLLKKDFSDLPAVSMHLHKNIPAGAGLGGGSADGAFTLLLLNKKFNLGITTDQLIKYASELGSDCPFFILNQPCLARGRGEILQPIQLDLSSFSFVLVNPGIHINTAWAFSQLKLSGFPSSLESAIQQPVETWKDLLVNDFELPVFEKFPEIASIKESFYSKGAIYAAMTGSGSSVFGIFEKNQVPELNLPQQYFTKTIE